MTQGPYCCSTGTLMPSFERLIHLCSLSKLIVALSIAVLRLGGSFFQLLVQSAFLLSRFLSSPPLMHLSAFVSFMDLGFLHCLDGYMLLYSFSFSFVASLLILYSCVSSMVCQRWNRVLTHSSIFVGFCFYSRNRVITRRSIYLAFLVFPSLLLALTSFFRLSLPYYGSYRVIRLLLSHFH